MANVKKIKYDISYTRGDTFSFVFDVSNLTQNDLTCAYMTGKEKDLPEGEALFSKKLNDGITKISTGKYRVFLSREDSIDLDVDGQYMYDVEIKFDSTIKTIMSGCFKVTQDYTTPEDEGSGS